MFAVQGDLDRVGSHWTFPLSLMKPSLPLSDPAVMLDTLHLAYRFALDACLAAKVPGDLIGDHLFTVSRLSVAEQYELGRRLVLYWEMKSLKPVIPTGGNPCGETPLGDGGQCAISSEP